VDGIRLCKAMHDTYKHCDMAHLEQKLQEHQDRRIRVIITDGVFSMDGDIAPLRQLAGACRAGNAWLFVDDAHGLGVLGESGRGSLEAAGLGIGDVPILMGTLGKALGTFGAFVAGSDELIETLLQKARTYVYTTALPPAVAAATRAALRVLNEEAWRRERVLGHVARFRREAATLGLRLLASDTPIQPVILGSEDAAMTASDSLRKRGLWVPAIRPPTVPKGSSRLRITFSAAHDDEDVERLLEGLAGLARQTPGCDGT
jgi:8-amino-7-oxononanoate synthase